MIAELDGSKTAGGRRQEAGRIKNQESRIKN
jgi:hypothetical protein